MARFALHVWVTVLAATARVAPVLGEDGSVLPLPLVKAIRSGPSPAASRQGSSPRTSARDTLVQVAQIYRTLYSSIAFGDTDHDGRNEVILYVNDNFTYHYRVLEEQGNNLYSDEYSGASLIPYATGDLDQDGKSEIIGQSGYQIQVYESVDSMSYPTQLVWTSSNLSNIVGLTAIGDTDRDGRMEIIHSVNGIGSSHLVIFENAGDNIYNQVYDSGQLAEPTGGKVIADLDGDGLIEIAFAGEYGRIYVYEASADNTWTQTWTEQPPNFDNAYTVVGGRDTDGNGKPELLVSGQTQQGFATFVYEATGDNTFARVATLHASVGAIANLDGLGRDEFLAEDGTNRLLIYRAVAPGRWLVVGEYQISDYQHSGLQAFDVNRNGRDEVFWDSGGLLQVPGGTLVLEHPPVSPSSVGDRPSLGAASLSVAPTPCRLQATLRAPASARQAASLTIFDVTGRLLERRVPVSDTSGQLSWPAEHLGPGIYLLRLESPSGAVLAVGRGVVVR